MTLTRTRALAICLSLVVGTTGCSDSTAPVNNGPGTFAFTGRFDRHVTTSFACNTNGCVMVTDSTPVNSPANGIVQFESMLSSPSIVSFTQCDLCDLKTSPSTAHTTRNGDSITVVAGISPSFQLKGVYRGDSIAGDVISYAYDASNSTYRGKFVAKRVP